MVRNLFIIFATVIAITLGGLTSVAQEQSSLAVVNVAGNPRFLSAHGFSSRINVIDFPIDNILRSIPRKKVCTGIANKLTEQGIGRKVIERLTDNGTTMPASGEASLPNTYIALTYTRTVAGTADTAHVPYYAIFHVEITPEQARQIAESVRSGAGLPAIDYPVTTLTYGKARLGRTFTSIARHIPALSITGHLTAANPPQTDLGTNRGIKKGDILTVYSSAGDKSADAARIRVSEVWDNGARGFYIDRRLDDKSRGTTVTRTPANPVRFGIAGTYATHNWGAQLTLDARLGFTNSGWTHHLLASAGASFPDQKDHDIIYDEYYHPDHIRSFFYYTIGVGYGIGKTIGGFMEVMPFVMTEYNGSRLGLRELGHSKASPYAVHGSGFRLPIGMRVNFNIHYPVQIYIEGGYAFHAYDNILTKSNEIIELAAKYNDIHRDGIFLNLGFIF